MEGEVGVDFGCALEIEVWDERALSTTDGVVAADIVATVFSSSRSTSQNQDYKTRGSKNRRKEQCEKCMNTT